MKTSKLTIAIAAVSALCLAVTGCDKSSQTEAGNDGVGSIPKAALDKAKDVAEKAGENAAEVAEAVEAGAETAGTQLHAAPVTQTAPGH